MNLVGTSSSFEGVGPRHKVVSLMIISGLYISDTCLQPLQIESVSYRKPYI